MAHTKEAHEEIILLPPTPRIKNNVSKQTSLSSRNSIGQQLKSNNPKIIPVLIKSIDTTEGAGIGSNVAGNINTSTAAEKIRNQK